MIRGLGILDRHPDHVVALPSGLDHLRITRLQPRVERRARARPFLISRLPFGIVGERQHLWLESLEVAARQWRDHRDRLADFLLKVTGSTPFFFRVNFQFIVKVVRFQSVSTMPSRAAMPSFRPVGRAANANCSLAGVRNRQPTLNVRMPDPK